MRSSSTFIRISGPIPEVKKSAMINDWENIIAHWELGKVTCRQRSVVSSTYSNAKKIF